MEKNSLLQEAVKSDLARGTFLEKWPNWLRWLLFLPAALLVPFLVSTLYIISTTWFLGIGPNAFFINLVRGVFTGAGFVFVGAAVAPRYQKIVSLILLVLMGMMTGLSLLSIFMGQTTLNEALEFFVTLVAAGYATYAIFQEKSA